MPTPKPKPTDVPGSGGDIDPQSPTHRVDRVVAALAEGQHGVVTRQQLIAHGFSRTVIRDRVRGGRLLALHRGVYAVGHRQLRREGYWLAAVLAVGPGAVLSHRQAAGLHGFRPANGKTIDVTTLADRRGASGIRVHQARRLGAEDITMIRAIPVTSVARTLVDLAGMVPKDHLTKALREADRMQLLDVRAVGDALERTRNRRGPGHKRMREALAHYAPLAPHDTHSPLEDDLLRLVHQARLPPPQTNVNINGLMVDALWPTQRVVVELDGLAYHLNRHAFQRDRERDRKLTSAGYQIYRYTHQDLTRHARRTIAELRGVLAP